MPAPKDLDPTTSLPALYGAKLRKLRLQAGLTQRELGDKIPIAHSRIARFELGKEVPPQDVSDALDKVLAADGDLRDLGAHIRRTPFPDWVRKYVTLEPQADKIRKYMAHTVPGLLQTESYARSLLEAARPSVGDRLSEMLAARLARQSILAQPESPVLWTVLDEAVLRRRVGGAVVMHEQLARLLRLTTDMGQVTVQVMPFDEEEHPLLGGSLTVLSFSRRPDVAYLESSHSGELVEQPATVAEYSLAFDHLQARALSPRDSTCMIRSAMEDICHDARLPTRTQRRRLAQVQPQQHPGRRLRRGR